LPADCDHHSEHIWKLPVPTQDKSLLFNLIRLHLESTTLSAPIRELHLEIIPVKPRLAQGNLFLPPAPEPEKLELTLERIRGVVGSTDGDAIPCVGSPSLVDTHKPGSFTLRNFSSLQEERLQPVRNSPDNIQSTPCHPERSRTVREATRPAKWKDPYFSSEAGTTAPTPALRLFRPALETTVGLDGSKPNFVRLWNRHRRVLAASGPWSTSGNWWNASVWTREEWDVALQTPAGLGFYRIYRDRLRRCWFVEGVFD
jgi:protein ImuB